MRTVAALLVLFAPDVARAATGTAVSLTVDMHAQWLRAWPTVKTNATPLDLRGDLPEAKHTIPGGAALGGVQAIYGVVIDDRIIYPLLGLGVATTTFRQPRVATSVDGSIAELQPWTAWYWTLLLPGLGLRAKERRWMGQMVVRPGVAWLSMDAEIAAGSETIDATARARPSFVLRAEGELCRRFDPVSRLCVFLAPAIYEHRWFGGGQFGIRWEMGR